MMGNIKDLVEKFLDGETTLEEEQELYDFFAQRNVPEGLRPFQEMFRDYACMETLGLKVSKEVKADIDDRSRTLDLKLVTIAASVVLIFSLGMGFLYYTSTNYAVAYVNGEKIRDEEVALNISRDAVSDIFSTEDNVSEELSDIFNPE